MGESVGEQQRIFVMVRTHGYTVITRQMLLLLRVCLSVSVLSPFPRHPWFYDLSFVCIFSFLYSLSLFHLPVAHCQIFWFLAQSSLRFDNRSDHLTSLPFVPLSMVQFFGQFSLSGCVLFHVVFVVNSD